MGLFGGGNSSSTSNNYDYNTYNTNDNRMVLGEGSTSAQSGGSISNVNVDNRVFSDSRADNRVFSDSRNLSSSDTYTDYSGLGAYGGMGATGGSSVSLTNTTYDAGALRAMETAMLSNRSVSESAIASANSSAAAAAAAARQASQDAMGSAAASQRSALDFAAGANAINGQGFQSLLSGGLNLLNKAFDATTKTQQFTADAYQTASAELSGSLDNKTIMILGLAAAAALAFFAVKK